jgi:hypothetical protein
MRRQQEDDYFGDVIYEVWRRGGDPDCVDRDRVRERYQDYDEADDVAHCELRRQRPRGEED